MGTAKGSARLKTNPVTGRPPALEYVPVADLLVDPAYQRESGTGSSLSLIRRIATYWDWRLCQVLEVSRRGDGKLYVVDGQHRLRGAELRGDIDALPCIVTDYADAGEEAAAFVALNQQRRPLNALDLFKAALTADDPAALHIARLMAEAGLSLAPHSNYTCWKPGMISNIGGVQRAYRVYGAESAAEALIVLGLAWHGEVLRYCGTLFPSIARIIADHEDYDRDLFVGLLRGKEQVRWVRAGAAQQSRVGGRRDLAVFTVMAEAYDALLGRVAEPPPLEPEPEQQKRIATDPPSEINRPPAMSDSDVRWCDQCDKRVSGFHVARCTDRFCKLRPALAA